MRAVRMLGVAEIRRRWRSVVVLTLLVGFVGAVVLSLAAGARRTESSLRRFEHDSLAADLEVGAGDATPAQIDQFRHSPGVAAVAQLRGIPLLDARGQFLPSAAQVDDRFGTIVDRARVIRGRKADLHKVDELTIGESLAAQLHLHLGGRIRFQSYSVAQINAAVTGGDPGAPAGPVVTFHVVGIVRRPLDLGGRGAQGGVIVPTPAFLRAYDSRLGNFSGMILRVRTQRGKADIPRVINEARRLFGPQRAFDITSLAVEGEGAQNAIDVTTSGLFIAVAVAGFAGIVGIGLALAREIGFADAHQLPLRALGMAPRHRIATAAALGLPVAVGGAALAALGSVLASAFFPIGVAGKAEPHPGIRFDGLVAVGGFFVVALAVLVIAGLAAARIARASERAPAVAAPTIVARSAAALAVPPTMGVGVHLALDRGKGRRALPVRSSLVGAAFGVAIVVGVLLFSTSLHHLSSTPRDYGWTWDVAVNDTAARSTNGALCGPLVTRATRIRSLSAVGAICTVPIEVAGHPVTAWGFVEDVGRIGPQIVKGHAPVAPDEVALGSRTLSAIHRHVGQRVRAVGSRGPLSYRIVGQVALPSLSDPQPLADGAAFTGPGLARIDATDSGVSQGSAQVVARFARGADRRATTKQLDSLHGTHDVPSFGPVLPVEIDRVRQIDGLPIALGAFVTVVAMVAVGYALIATSRRRRRDLAILKTLGFTRAQVRVAMAWHATTVSVVGLVVGIPLGLVFGRFVWKSVADGFGVSTNPTWPVVGTLVLVPATVLLVNLVAAVPARSAARTPPAVVLRSE